MPSWRRKWLSEQARWVELECGHLQDLSIKVLIFIDAFDGADVECVPCEGFKRIKKVHKPLKTKYPDEPLF